MCQQKASVQADKLSSDYFEFEVLDNAPFVPNCGNTATSFLLRLAHCGKFSAKAGQFVMLRPQELSQGLFLGSPFARPFSVSAVSENELHIVYQLAGEVTTRMSALQKGEKVDLWGPLGSVFSVEEAPTLLIAGGIGIAPFVGYIKDHPRPENLTMVFGHRLPKECYPVEKLEKSVNLTTFHDSCIADLECFLSHIKGEIEAHAKKQGLVLVCGPHALLKAAQKMAKESGVRMQLSLEEVMFCGVGACLGCVTKTNPSYVAPENTHHVENMPVQSCLHGPVFWADQIIL